MNCFHGQGLRLYDRRHSRSGQNLQFIQRHDLRRRPSGAERGHFGRAYMQSGKPSVRLFFGRISSSCKRDQAHEAFASRSPKEGDVSLEQWAEMSRRENEPAEFSAI